jgi:lysophospholipase L1-like esterase
MIATSVILVAVVGAAVYALRRDRPRETTIDSDSIVMLGDSITEEGRWSELLPAVPIVNEGHSGFTTEQLDSIAAEVATARPARVFVLTGTNDIRDDRPPSWTALHLASMLDRFADVAPDTEVVLQTVLPRADAPDAVRATNEAIKAVAAERELVLLDLHPAFDDGSGGLEPTDTRDGIHLSAAGYDRWAALLEPLLGARG